MEEVAGGEAAVDTVDAAPAVVERDWEAEARDQGWVPEAEFKGEKKPRKFLTAEEFVERGDWADSITKKVEARYETRFKNLERVSTRTIASLEAQHAKEIAGLKTERRAAIKDGDADKVEEIDGKIDALKEQGAEAPSSSKTKGYDDYADDFAPDTQDGADYQVLVTSFVQKNPWMIDEPEMASYAQEVSKANAAANPSIGFKANMKYVLERVQRKFPAYFKSEDNETAANAHAAVDGGGSHSGPAGKSSPLDKLPAEARQQARADMAKYPKIYPNADAWVRAYNG